MLPRRGPGVDSSQGSADSPSVAHAQRGAAQVSAQLVGRHLGIVGPSASREADSSESSKHIINRTASGHSILTAVWHCYDSYI